MDDDLALFAAWVAGDQRAGSALFDRHAASILLFFRSKVGDSAAEDLLQETFLACLKARETFRGDAAFRTYLFRAARSRLLNFVQRERPRLDAMDPAVTSVADIGLSPSALLSRVERDRRLLTVLRKLPLELQILLELHYFERLTTSDLADVLELPVGTVRSRLRRARQLLHGALERAGPREVEQTLGSLESWAERMRQLAGHK